MNLEQQVREKYRQFLQEGRSRSMSGRLLRRWTKRKILKWMKKTGIKEGDVNNEIQNNTEQNSG